MKVFVTGATGFIGSAIVQELLGAGHQVLGLARSEASADALRAAGAEVHYGSLEDAESLQAGAANSDGVIHTGFIHDFSNYVASCETDRKAIAALAAGLANSGKPLVVTSGTALLASGQVTTEESLRPADSILPRVSELAAADAAKLGVNVSIVRLPPSVHGDGDHGFIPMLIHVAREKNAAAYVGDGSNRWPAVHRLDAAKLYKLAVEKAAKDVIYQGVADTGVPMRDIAAVIGKRLGVTVISKTPEEAAAHFGWLAHFTAIDNPSTSEITQNLLGWKPTHIGLLEDIENGAYF
jgi:nucleoside-diphosphate-sugar epimerase